MKSSRHRCMHNFVESDKATSTVCQSGGMGKQKILALRILAGSEYPLCSHGYPQSCHLHGIHQSCLAGVDNHTSRFRVKTRPASVRAFLADFESRIILHRYPQIFYLSFLV